MQVERQIANEWLRDEKSFEKLFRMYYEPLVRYALGILNDLDEAEESVQQAFISCWEKRSELPLIASMKPYLYRAVRNNSLNRLKHLKVRMEYSQAYHAHAESFETPAPAGELQSLIQRAIESLPAQCGAIFKLSRFEGMKYAEIAAHLDISIKTVENQMGKALRLLREKLRDYLILILLFLDILLLT